MRQVKIIFLKLVTVLTIITGNSLLLSAQDEFTATLQKNFEAVKVGPAFQPWC